MVEISCDCNECLRMLGLYPSKGVNDIIRHCRCHPRWNVNNDDNRIWELSWRIECTETNLQQFNVWTTYPLLNGHIAGINPSLIKKQDNTPSFPLPLVFRSRSARMAVKLGMSTHESGMLPFSQDSDRQTALLIQPLVPHKRL